MNCTVMINHSDVNNNNPKLNEDLWKKVNSNQFDTYKIIRNITANNCSKFQVCIQIDIEINTEMGENKCKNEKLIN